MQSAALLQRLQCTAPFIQAPMAGGFSNTAMAKAAITAGGCGSIAAAYIPPEQLKAELTHFKQEQASPAETIPSLLVNLFVPPTSVPMPSKVEVDNAVKTAFRCRSILRRAAEVAKREEEQPSSASVVETHDALMRAAVAAEDADPTPIAAEETAQMVKLLETSVQRMESEYAKKCEILLETPPSAVSFTFGLPSERVLKDLKAKGVAVIATVTTPEEAALAAAAATAPTSDAPPAASFDALIAQGCESGGHRGSLPTTNQTATAPWLETEALVAQVNARLQGGGGAGRPETSIPIIAAGGVRTADDVSRLLEAGASAVQVGSALLGSRESGASLAHFAAFRHLAAAPDGRQVTRTRWFSGRLAQGFDNFVMRQATPPLPFPLQNDLTVNAFRKEAQGYAKSLALPVRLVASEFLPIWSGSGFAAECSEGAAPSGENTGALVWKLSKL